MKKIITNSSRKITNTNKYISWLICMFLFIAPGMQRAQSQNQPSLQQQTNGTGTNHNIQEYSIAKTQYTVNKSVNPKIIFDNSTPFFNQLVIVDADNNPIQNIITSDDGTTIKIATKKTFDFTKVPNGTYYAMRIVTGESSVYYKIDVK